MKKTIIITILSLSWSLGFSQNTFKIIGNNVKVNGTTSIVLKNTQFVNNGTFDAANGVVIISGDASDAQSSIGGTSTTTFYNLTINKSSNGTQLNDLIQVDNELTMTSGNLDLNNNDLILGSTGSTIVGESTLSYIHGSTSGEVIKTLGLNAPSNENPGNIGVTITSSADLGSTTIKRGHVIQDVNGEQSIVRYYDIDPANNSGLDATVKFSYMDHELNGIPEDELAPFRFNGTDWDEYLASDFDENANWVETSNIDAFSIWTLALEIVPLPVELFHFAAKKLEKEVLLEWITASEENNRGFSVERKTAFENWTQVGFVEGNGTTFEFSNYHFVDINPESGNNYYRLKQIDFDGAFDYSAIRVIEFTKAGIDISIYPNPTNDVVNIRLDENINEGRLQLFDQLGRLILQETIVKSEYLKTIQVSQFPEGVYTIKIISNKQRFSEKFIIQKPN